MCFLEKKIFPHKKGNESAYEPCLGLFKGPSMENSEVPTGMDHTYYVYILGINHKIRA